MFEIRCMGWSKDQGRGTVLHVGEDLFAVRMKQ